MATELTASDSGIPEISKPLKWTVYLSTAMKLAMLLVQFPDLVFEYRKQPVLDAIPETTQRAAFAHGYHLRDQVKLLAVGPSAIFYYNEY